MKIDRYMLRGVWQALNFLSTDAIFCVIVAGASPGETKMWAAVRENGDFFTFVDHVKTNIFFNLSESLRTIRTCYNIAEKFKSYR